MDILGIETSCDETAAAVVRDGRHVMANCVFSQIARHAPFGGVVPEVAARSHVEILPGIMRQALDRAGCDWDGIGAIAATYGPGLASSLLVGATAAKTLAMTLERPLYLVNHLEAHLYSVFLGDAAPRPDAVCPMLTLLVSGGNTCLVLVRAVGDYTVLGQTLDDAAGEALDKGATLLGLGYPGGPALEEAAAGGDPSYERFPRGLAQNRSTVAPEGQRRDLCFSFSGVKTALRYYLRKHPAALSSGRLADIAASYQWAVFDALLIRIRRGLDRTGAGTFALVGGVARNQVLRRAVDRLMSERSTRLLLTPAAYCTDNAAMIAGLAGCADGVETWDDPVRVDVCPNLTIRSALPE